MTIEVTRRASFCAGHRYWRPEWTPARNHETFGACANENGHGHNYSVEVTLSGPVDPVNGMVVNLTDVDKLIQTHVIELLDHKNLNLDVPGLAGKIPTTEVLAGFVWDQLVSKVTVARLVRVRICESDNLWAECCCDDAT
ncbi:MAG: 6-carboxytetrahydropterin synthase [candidate division Zixibacteria bacterium]|nr:6-carboxytetrahydropterin synthase [candidate division Zixibacteria bacterium]